MKIPTLVTARQAIAGSVLVGLWLAITLPVFSQEACYWCYSQHPAPAYFDHPPMVAWMIWLGTQAFGDAPVFPRRVRQPIRRRSLGSMCNARNARYAYNLRTCSR